VPLRRIEDRWRDYAGDDAGLLAGSTVAHTDLHRHNIMIGDRVKLVDWAWPTLAAPWLDTACIGLQLIEAGHHPEDAERWCQQSSAYAAAPADAISVFVGGACAMWREISAADRQPWKFDVTAAAERWAKHRRL
jgi:thiamine kinase-like enzyme